MPRFFMPRFAMCNEAFEKTPFDQVCRSLREAGYTGIELAPFTLGDWPASITPAERREFRSIMQGEGLEFVGLHWLMVSPHKLHVTTPDDELRTRSWNYVRDLVDLSADLAGGASIMVFGSPKQRGSTGGSTRVEATRRFVDGLSNVARHAQSRDVTVLVEALPAAQCDVVQSLAEAASIVREIGSPAIQTMFDTHNAIDETTPHVELVEEFFPLIKHVHVNELDGRYPGAGDYDFGALLRTLDTLQYAGWVSLEVFEFPPDPFPLARRSLEFLSALTQPTQSPQ